MIKTKVFDDYDDLVEISMNHFISDKNVVDIKMNTVVSNTGRFFTRYLVIYKDKDKVNTGYNPHK